MRAVSRRTTSSSRGSRVARELARARGRLDVVEPDDAALRLRDDLLRDDDDVAVLELRALGDQRAEVVALADLGQAFDRRDRQITAGR